MMQKYLTPTPFIDFNDPLVVEFTHKYTNSLVTDIENIVSLYYAVRDSIVYSPWHIILRPDAISASQTITRGIGYCIEKSLVLAASGRLLGVPSRLGFSIVRNHISSQKFIETLRTDKFVFHGYNEFFLDGNWVKCTPAFNKSLCEKFGTEALEFNGREDSIFQSFSPDGKKYMEYLHEYGTFDDLPYDLFYAELKKHYGHLFENGEKIFTPEVKGDL